MAENTEWVESPITKRMMVMQELNEDTGVSKMDISTGYFTNELPMNYKKNGMEKVAEYESSMPDAIKRLRFDDGESYWYPSTLQTKDEVIFPSGETYEKVTWHYAKMNAESVINAKTVVDCSSYLEVVKLTNGHTLGNI